jgi:RNA polymerase sigma-70 factor (ECF subfamily)
MPAASMLLLRMSASSPNPPPVGQADRVLLDRIASGDEAALGTLYDRYAPTLYAVAYRVSGERADAEEIVLDSFAQAWREAGRFRQERGSVIAWLTMICRSRALDLVRARRRRSRLTEAAGAGSSPESEVLAMGRPTPADQETEQKERCRVVARALDTLPDSQRRALELAFYDGLSQSEIAERLGEPLGTVKTRVRTAMQKLRDALRPYYFEPNP